MEWNVYLTFQIKQGKWHSGKELNQTTQVENGKKQSPKVGSATLGFYELLAFCCVVGLFVCSFLLSLSLNFTCLREG